MRKLPALLLALTLPVSVGAQTNLKATPFVTTVTTTSGPCVPASNGMIALYIENANDGAHDIWYTAQPSAAVVGGTGAGSFLLAATGNTNKWWVPGSAPRNGLNCIANGGSETLTGLIYTQN